MNERKIKILHLGSNLRPVVAGSRQVMLNLMENMDKDRFEIGIFFKDAHQEQVAKISSKVKLFDFRWISKIKGSGRWANLCVIYTIFKFKPDIIWIDGRRFGFFFSDKLKRIFPSVKLVFRRGGIISESQLQNKEYVNWLKARYSNADAIICASRLVEEQVVHRLSLPSKRTRVIHNGIDASQIIQKSKLENHRNHKTRTNRIICYVGALNERKDPLTLVRGFEAALKVVRNIELWIVGKGVLEEEIREYCRLSSIDNSVKLLGFKQNPYPYMVASDLFASTSTRDGFGLTLLEAAALKKPLLYAQGEVGIGDLLQKHDVGWQFPVHDFKRLSELMIRFFLKDNLYNFQGYSALTKELSVNHFVRHYEDVFESVVSNKLSNSEGLISRLHSQS